jgi:predicted AAA+ superfamily ATPase
MRSGSASAREARDRKVEIPWTKELEREAIQWSQEKSKRCGRTAYQFSKNYVGRFLLLPEKQKSPRKRALMSKMV